MPTPKRKKVAQAQEDRIARLETAVITLADFVEMGEWSGVYQATFENIHGHLPKRKGKKNK